MTETVNPVMQQWHQKSKTCVIMLLHQTWAGLSPLCKLSPNSSAEDLTRCLTLSAWLHTGSSSCFTEERVFCTTLWTCGVPGREVMITWRQVQAAIHVKTKRKSYPSGSGWRSTPLLSLINLSFANLDWLKIRCGADRLDILLSIHEVCVPVCVSVMLLYSA